MVYDPEYTSAKKRIAKGLKPLEPMFDCQPCKPYPELEDSVDAWEFIENRLGVLEMEKPGFAEELTYSPERAISFRDLPES